MAEGRTAPGGLPNPAMDWTNPDRATALAEFKQMCNFRFTAEDTKKERQYSHILLWAGPEGIRLSNTWGLSAEDLKKPEKIWEKFAESEPQDNFRIHRLELQQYKQNSTETVDDFITRCKTKVMKCKFPTEDARNERLIEQITAGIKYPEVQRKLLRKDDTLTLKQAIDICRSHEASVTQMEKMSSLNKAVTVDAVDSRHASGKPCGNCGTKHAPRKCPAYNTKCGACGKMNHWKKCCRSAKTSSQGGRDSPQRGGGKQKGGFQQRRRSSTPHHHRRHDNINAENESDSDYNDDNIVFEPINFSTVDNNDERTEVYANLSIKLNKSPPAKLKVKVDTGAQGNIIPLRIFRRMYPQQLDEDGYPKPGSTQQRRTVLVAYNGSTINQFGSVRLPCKYGKSDWHTEEFYITDADGPAILGLPGSTRLQLVTLHCPIQSKPVKADPTPIQDVKELKHEFPDRFEGIGAFHGDLHITLKDDAQPVIQPPRKYPIQLLPEIKAELEKMEKTGVIIPVQEPTDWVNSLAFSRKSSGGLRVCLDPKDLNKSIKRTHHKTPTLEEITNRFSGAKLFSKLDARHGYWSVKLDDESSRLTTFNSPFGRFRFLRLPFGLNVSQDIFQKHMDDILSQCPGTLGITDDVVVFGKDEAEHDRNLRHLMEVARKMGLVFNEDKCYIKRKQVKFFGMIYDADGVHPDPDKVKEIKNLPSPKNVTELQQFLGMVQYMSPFIPKLADHTAALRALTKKDVDWDWNNSHEKAYQKVKSMICENTSLTYFDVSKPATIQVDASQQGLGATLVQNGKPIAYASKALTETEKRYANIERELLAVVFGCERFNTYVYGKPFTVESDHKPLEQIQKKSLASTPPRLQRMMLRLQKYDVNIVYRPGKEMVLADMLSRFNPTAGPEIDVEKSVFAVQFSSDRLQQLKDETCKDPHLTTLKNTIIKGWPEKPKDLPKNLRQYWSLKEELTVEDDIILKGDRVMIPESMKQYVLQTIHSGHQGIEKCRLRAQTCVYWHGLNHDIETIVKTCQTCLRHQKSQPHEELSQHEIPERPWHTIGTDIMTMDGNDYIVLCDYYSKMPFVRRTAAAGQTTSKSIISVLSQIFGEQGIPEKVISDNGKPYVSIEFKKFTDDWGFQHVTSSPRYPRSNGLAERTVQTLKNIMTKAKESHTDVNLALLAFRSTPIDHKLPSPAELLYSRKLKTTLPSVIPNNLSKKKEVRKQLEKRQEQQKFFHDRTATRSLPPLSKGQPVMMQKEEGGKWTPATVVQTGDEPRSYVVQSPNGATYRRNRKHLMNLQKPAERRVRFSDKPEIIETRTPMTTQKNDDQPQPAAKSPDVQQDVTQPVVETSAPPQRPQRTIKKPERLIESI